jgi:hypothetical protein
LADFRNSFNPRIGVTVDRIVTGTVIKSLECLIVMRDVLPPVPSYVVVAKMIKNIKKAGQ